MSKVSEKAIYSNYTAIPINTKVSIIQKDFTIYNTSDFGTYSTDDSKFLDGILLSKTVIDYRGYGGIVEYKVKLENSGQEITFRCSPREYYFKVIEPHEYS